MTQPIAVDLYCGLGGWTEGLLAEGYYVVGLDIERHEYGEEKYPAQLVLQDVLTIHGRQFRNVDLIVASPPCQEYSYMAMPWSKAKQKAREYRDGTRDVKDLTALFDACFRIQREASEAACRHIPMVVENVRGAQEWVGRSRWNYGSFHLWGDVPALMPIAKTCIKVPGLNWSAYGTLGYKAKGFNTTADQNVREGIKGIPHCTKGHWTNPAEHSGVKQGGDWFNKASGNSISRRSSSKSNTRKRASATIAKIPFALSSYIARLYHPREMSMEQRA